MQWFDVGIIISVTKHAENAGIVSVFTAEHGLAKGFVRSIHSKKSRGLYQAGNEVQVQWRGRLPEYLGNFTCELHKQHTAYFMDDAAKLACLTSLCALFEHTLAEHEQHPQLYTSTLALLKMLSCGTSWQGAYIQLELQLLQQLGFGLDLSCCAATGSSDDLAYISPKSGRAVSAQAGAPYKNKLLPLPDFLHYPQTDLSHKQIEQGLMISGYFLEKFVFAPEGKTLPDARRRLIGHLTKHLA